MVDPKESKTGRLLIVDDEEEICDFLSEFFKGRGYFVQTASTPEEALRLAFEERPNLILLDLRLRSRENCDGLLVLEEIKKRDPALKVIMVTAVEDPEVIQQAMELGASDYITKPLSLEYLEGAVMAKINEALS